MPIGGFEDLVGHDVLVCIAGALRRHAGDEVVGAQVGQHRQLRIEQGHVDVLAPAAGVAVAQCGLDRDRGVEAGEQVGDGHADLLRSAAGAVVALSRHAHQPAHALHGVVVAGAVAVGPRLAEAGDRAIDQARLHCQQRCGIEAVARHVANLEVFDQHVALRHQAPDQRLAFGVGQIDRDRAFVAVAAEVVGGLGGVGASAVFQEGRAPAARVVATGVAIAGRSFDLDHIGAEVGQGLRAPGAGEHAR